MVEKRAFPDSVIDRTKCSHAWVPVGSELQEPRVVRTIIYTCLTCASWTYQMAQFIGYQLDYEPVEAEDSINERAKTIERMGPSPLVAEDRIKEHDRKVAERNARREERERRRAADKPKALEPARVLKLDGIVRNLVLYPSTYWEVLDINIPAQQMTVRSARGTNTFSIPGAWVHEDDHAVLIPCGYRDEVPIAGKLRECHMEPGHDPVTNPHFAAHTIIDLNPPTEEG